MSQQVCKEWAVEVDPDRKKYNLAAQEQFVVDFIAPAYSEMLQADRPLSKIQSLHFTRIYNPDRDDMGAYVRVRVFCDQDDLDELDAAIDARLSTHFGNSSTLKIVKSDLNWPKTCTNYGGPEVADLFRDYLHNASRTVSELLTKKQAGYDIERVLWPWTHFWFNAARGYGRAVIEMAQGAITGFMPNI